MSKMSKIPGQADRDPVMSRVLGPTAVELSCEECFAELDRYAELTIADERPDDRVPGMRAHLEGCPACNEDLRSLLALLESGAEDPGQAPRD
jgi:hypothetical protein